VKPVELARVRFTFGLLGAVPVFLAGWLGWVQVAQAGELEREGRAPLRLVPATADVQAWRHEALPAPRGTIVDRHGALLALDREAYEVRADIRVPTAARGDCERLRNWLGLLIDELSLALADDPGLADRSDARRRYAERLARTLRREFRLDDLPLTGPVPAGQPLRADVLVASEVDVLSVVQALRRLGRERRWQTVTLHFLRSFQRVYPERDLTYGFVGHVVTRWENDAAGNRALVTAGASGLEMHPGLAADEAAKRRFLKDGRGRPYFVAPLAEVPQPAVLRSTLDLELQRLAVRELAAQAAAGAREGKVTVPQWGALVLVEIESGDVLAAASWHRDARHPQASAFTPTQSLFEPGSIVKPLVLAYAHEVGVLDWRHVFDCAPGSRDYRDRIARLGRAKPVRDDHDCGPLDAHGILVNSSNIGAAYCGLLLDRAQWRDYMDFYGVGASLRLGIPHSTGGVNRKSFAAGTPLRSFQANSAISFSFGYEHQVTAMHIARAYLRLFRGSAAELRVWTAIEADGVVRTPPADERRNARFRPEVVEAARLAMVDVVSPIPGATGVHLHARMLKELGIDLHGLIGGKTGTAATNVPVPGRGTISARNASFVGFLPADAPRWLAVCVLQKDDSARFYGGSYAAPPVVRLLLQCQQLEQRRLLRQESPDDADGQVRKDSASPGYSGWGLAASETTAVGGR
jgi:cell division protein FtsI (penicillin-binding protein 3)